MPTLVSRQKYVPGGFKFFQPEIKWQAPPNASFDVIVNTLIAARRGNPSIMQKYGWSTDYNAVANEVDRFNAKMCQDMGWTDYYMPDGGQAAPPPFIPASPSSQNDLSAAASRVKAIWAGVRTLNDWIDSGTPAVPADKSAARAAVCAICPKNTQGDFTAWFTRPAAEAIKRQIEKVQSRNLSTPDDARLNVCDVCYCPLKLKVHAPIEYIRMHMGEEVLSGLRAVPGCWIIKELA